MNRRMYLHVGLPTGGTASVQTALWRGRDQLAQAGVLYPLREPAEHLVAVRDLQSGTVGSRLRSRGAWERVAARVRRSDATAAVFSNAQLAAADAAAVSRVVKSFPDHELHLVVTVRSLSTALVMAWQTQLRRRAVLRLDDFVAGWLGEDDASADARRLGAGFHRLHDLPDVLERWSTAVAAERIHLVTSPEPTGTDTLVRGFASVVGADPDIGVGITAPHDRSLDAASAELLRRINMSGAADIAEPHYGLVVRRLLADKVLTGADAAPPVLPQRFAEAVRLRVDDTVGQLQGRGYDVVGDLQDLEAGSGLVLPGEVAEVEAAELAAASASAVAGLLTELGPLQRRLRARRGPVAGKARGLQRMGQRIVPARARRGVSRVRRRGAALARSPLPGRKSTVAGPVYLHIGAPKTGTTFLQDILWHHREQLASAGVLFARRRYEDHFRATLDLRGIKPRDDGTDPDRAGAWAQVVDDTCAWAGTSVISHELFAGARKRHVQRAVTSLGPDRLHVVYTVRDLWGLLSAEWQEATKHGNVLSFDDYLADVFERAHAGVVGDWFWLVHDPVDVLARWSAHLPADQVHVVTVPPAGTDPGLLWQRFAHLVGIDARSVDTSVARWNPSLGGREVTFLRHVNAVLGGRDGALAPGEYSRLVKELLAQRILSARPGKIRYTPPPERFAQVHDLAEQFVKNLREAGYSVHGTLDELLPRGPGSEHTHPDSTSAEELIEVGLDAITGLLAAAVRAHVEHDKQQPGRMPRLRRMPLLTRRVTRRAHATASRFTGRALSS